MGPLYRLLLLTGARLNEVAKATWPEIDTVLTIPAERFKSGRTNVIALSTDALALLAKLPRWLPVKNNPRHFVFSSVDGSKPVNAMNKAKGDMDKRMIRTLKAMARKRGDDPKIVTLPRWVNHDLRRVVRSGLSELRVAPFVAELILGHELPALWGTYDRFTYLEEKREALEKWADFLRVGPTSNVVSIRPRKTA